AMADVHVGELRAQIQVAVAFIVDEPAALGTGNHQGGERALHRPRVKPAVVQRHQGCGRKAQPDLRRLSTPRSRLRGDPGCGPSAARHSPQAGTPKQAPALLAARMSNTLTPVLVASLHLDHLATEYLARVSGRTPSRIITRDAARRNGDGGPVERAAR